MAITLPEHLREVLDVLGFHFPAINEDILEEHARAWKAFADELEHIIGDTDRAARMVADQNYGQAIDAFNGFWQGVGGQGDLRLAQEAASWSRAGSISPPISPWLPRRPPSPKPARRPSRLASESSERSSPEASPLWSAWQRVRVSGSHCGRSSKRPRHGPRRAPHQRCDARPATACAASCSAAKNAWRTSRHRQVQR